MPRSSSGRSGVASPCAFWPRASQVITTPDTVMTPIDTVTAPAAKNFRTRALMVKRLRPATRMPATRPTSAVLVCVRRRIATDEGDASQGDTTAQQAGEPEHDRQPGRDRCVLGHLRGRHWPDHPGEPATESEGLTRGDHEAKQHRAERHVEAAKLTPEEQHVASAPPRRQQPERGHELGEPEGPEHPTEVRCCRDGDHRVYDEQAHEAEERVRAQPELGVRGQCQQERERQGALREPLAHVGRDV